MTRITHHPSRQRMITAVETGAVGFRSHLKECEACCVLFELLTKFWAKNEAPLPQSSPQLLRRIESIPNNFPRELRSPVLMGHLISDSWSNLARFQMRDGATDLSRRLLLKAGSVKLELVAEWHLDRWEFAAKVYDRGRASAKFTIAIGRRKIRLGSSGYFYWSSKRPPAKVRLLGESHTIVFDGLSW